MRKLVIAVAVLAAQAAPVALLVFDGGASRPGSLPDGWRLKVHRGAPNVAIVREGGAAVLHLKSQSSSFGLEREVDVDLARLPYLTWSWKVSELPRGGDFRRSAADDQAAQVLVLFPDRKVLAYIWDTSAPKGTIENSGYVPLIRVQAIVCRSGGAELNRWVSESRNLSDDYLKAFGRRPERVRGLRLQINSQHTGTSAESYFGDVAFRSTPG